VSARGGKASALVAAGTDAGGPGDRGLKSRHRLVWRAATLARRSRPIAVAGLATAVTLLVLRRPAAAAVHPTAAATGEAAPSPW
jgi:hypothetical protein